MIRLQQYLRVNSKKKQTVQLFSRRDPSSPQGFKDVVDWVNRPGFSSTRQITYHVCRVPVRNQKEPRNKSCAINYICNILQVWTSFKEGVKFILTVSLIMICLSYFQCDIPYYILRNTPAKSQIRLRTSSEILFQVSHMISSNILK